jgi:hypothetical protein
MADRFTVVESAHLTGFCDKETRYLYVGHTPPTGFDNWLSPETYTKRFGVESCEKIVALLSNIAEQEFHAFFQNSPDSTTGPRNPPESTTREPGAAVNQDELARRAIDEIRGGPHGDMPPAQATSGRHGSGTEMIVQNSTPYSLSVYLSGPLSRVLEIAPDGVETVKLLPGHYEIAAKISGHNVMSYFGPQDYEADTHYKSQFYIERQFR